MRRNVLVDRALRGTMAKVALKLFGTSSKHRTSERGCVAFDQIALVRGVVLAMLIKCSPTSASSWTTSS